MPPTGTSHPWWSLHEEAVSGCEHPLGIDDGAPTDMSRPILEAHLPGPFGDGCFIPINDPARYSLPTACKERRWLLAKASPGRVPGMRLSSTSQVIWRQDEAGPLPSMPGFPLDPTAFSGKSLRAPSLPLPVLFEKPHQGGGWVAQAASEVGSSSSSMNRLWTLGGPVDPGFSPYLCTAGKHISGTCTGNFRREKEQTER